jgi:medium-chain acyl-[acyl-carrier-protein] hydrolase
LEPLVQALADALEPEIISPYAIFGQCIGAIIAFELVRALRRRTAPGPLALFVGGSAAPQLFSGGERLSELPTAAFIAKVRRIGMTPEEILDNEELRDLLLPLLRADFAVAESYDYHHEPPLTCPIYAFAAIDDDFLALRDVEAWREHTVGDFTVQATPGGHLFGLEPDSSTLTAVWKVLMSATTVTD